MVWLCVAAVFSLCLEEGVPMSVDGVELGQKVEAGPTAPWVAHDGGLLLLGPGGRVTAAMGSELRVGELSFEHGELIMELERHLGPGHVTRSWRDGRMFAFRCGVRVWCCDGKRATFYLLGPMPDDAIKELSGPRDEPAS